MTVMDVVVAWWGRWWGLLILVGWMVFEYITYGNMNLYIVGTYFVELVFYIMDLIEASLFDY